MKHYRQFSKLFVQILSDFNCVSQNVNDISNIKCNYYYSLTYHRRQKRLKSVLRMHDRVRYLVNSGQSTVSNRLELAISVFWSEVDGEHGGIVNGLAYTPARLKQKGIGLFLFNYQCWCLLFERFLRQLFEPSTNVRQTSIVI